MKSNLNFLNRFIGYGNPDMARVFFFGIEEGSQFTTVDQFHSWINSPYIQHFAEFHNNITPGKAKGNTDLTRCWISYKIRTEVLNHKLIPFEQYIKYEISEYYEFFSNVYPMPCSADKNPFNVIHEQITGYSDKSKYRQECWDGTGGHDGIISRQAVLRTFFKYLKGRIDSEKVWVFITGLTKGNHESPAYKILPILSEIFDIEENLLSTESDLKKVVHESSIYHMYGNKIWLTQHPKSLFASDYENIIRIIKNG